MEKLLITPEKLNEILSSEDATHKNVIVLQGSYDQTSKSKFLEDRIPGAQLFDLEECSDPGSDFAFMLPSGNQFTEYVLAKGISDSTKVVVYDADPILAAAGRVWWMFKVFGHEDVLILDGGLKLWRQLGFSVERGPPSVTPTKSDDLKFVVRSKPDMVRAFEDVRDNLTTKKYQLVETRAARDRKDGTIPGCKFVDYEHFFRADGRWKGKEELAEIMAEAGIDVTAPTISTCVVGISACSWAFIARLLGENNVFVYDGSWYEWCQRYSRNKL